MKKYFLLMFFMGIAESAEVSLMNATADGSVMVIDYKPYSRLCKRKRAGDVPEVLRGEIQKVADDSCFTNYLTVRINYTMPNGKQGSKDLTYTGKQHGKLMYIASGRYGKYELILVRKLGSTKKK